MKRDSKRMHRPTDRILGCLKLLDEDGGWVLQAELQRTSGLSDASVYLHYNQLVEQGAIERTKVGRRAWMRLNIGPTPPPPTMDATPAQAGPAADEPAESGSRDKPFVHRLVPAGTPPDVPRGVANSVFAFGGSRVAWPQDPQHEHQTTVLHTPAAPARPPRTEPRLKKLKDPVVTPLSLTFRCALWSDGGLHISAPSGLVMLDADETRTLLHYLDKLRAEAA